jgi:sulfite reductase (NADPH) flavoprotein alpha-component
MEDKLIDDNTTFKIVLAPEPGSVLQSGDLLAIYPAADGRERFYSIGQNKGMIQLIVKLHENGLGSGYLYQLDVNTKLKARIMHNPGFHFPQKARSVVMIANGTGIAPFLGMIMNNRTHIPVRMYAEFRYDNEQTKQYRQFVAFEIGQKRLESLNIAFSRGTEPMYVMVLIRKDPEYFTDLLANHGVIMICGSLKMQKDVELLLDELSLIKHNQGISFYKKRNQLMTDCY